MKKKRSRREIKPEEGAAPPGQSIDPLQLPEEAEADSGLLRIAPGPGVPISDEEYRRLKESAARPKGRNKAGR
jgi:hypothetical protein